ncbi:amino acid adenylation domain-containing protein [Lysobacter firmicutimachus]|uniref:Amino acid adenylation domain-containing protein n=3 Tax=Lysobacter TaxID=68 RepID=A0ABU8D593_9GAMM
MNASELMATLQARGLSLRLDGERLRLLGDPQALAESALVEALRERKSELIALLRERGAVAGGDYRIDEGATAISPQMLPLAGLDQAAIDRLLAQVPGGAGNVQDVYPLAPLQEGILFHHRLHGEGEGDAYVMPTRLRFDSRERLDRFVDALQEVIARHDTLRTSVHWEGLEQPVQVVHRRAELKIETSIAAAGVSAAEHLQTQADPRRFRLDVRRAPMLSGHAVQDPDDGRWLLQLLHHHLILDHTASELLVQEVMLILQGRRSQLPAPVPFRRFVAQARLGMGQPEHEAYFRRELGDVDETTVAFGLRDVQGDGSGVIQARTGLDPGLARRLREQARAHGVGAASLFHLAWAQVLGLCSGRDDVVFGTVLFGRLQAGADAARAMGMFLNTLPLRVRIDGRPVETALRAVHASLAELLRHEHASLSLAQRCSGLPADAPLFASLLNYRYSQRDGTIPALQGVESLGGHDRTNYPFVLHVDDYGDGFGLTAEVERSVDAQRICGFVEQALQALVDALEREPQRPLDRLERLPAQEREQVLQAFNATDTEYPRGLLLHQLFERQAAQRPDAIALAFEGRRLSYAELNARANRWARRLRLLGVGPDARVGVCLQRSEHLVIALLATLKAGGAYLPLDPALPSERLQQLLDEAAPVAVLTESALESRLPATSLPVVALDRDTTASVLAGHDLDPAEVGLGERHLAYVIYTSGSTGRPKGVMNEHRGIVNRLHWMQQAYALTEQDVVLQKTPFGFDVSVWEFFWPLMAGAQLVLARPEGHKDPAYLGELIRSAGVTTLHFVPSMLQLFLARLDAVAGCASLRRVICSGEALPAALARQCRERLPQARLYNLYGPTEAAVDVTAWTCSAADETVVPIGRPIANTRLYLLDAALRPVPVGVAGELYIGGVQVARGYLNRPDLTAERFIADPFDPSGAGRLYKTGDLGRWRADGAIEYLGRNDFQVKLRGQRIELGEIEAQLCALDDIADAAVLAREDLHGALALVAYVVPAAGTDAPVPAALRERLGRRLPDYMLPTAYVALAALPLSGNGKLDRKALPAPDQAAFGHCEYAPPQGEVEQALAAIWSQLLGVERVGRHDSFFALGGHSLLAVQLLEHLRRRDWTIDVRAVFAQPELAAMAAAVRGIVAPGQGEVAVPRNAIPERFDESPNEHEIEEFRL